MDNRADWVLPRAEVQRVLNEATSLFTTLRLDVASLDPGHRLRRVVASVSTDLATHGDDGQWEHGPDTIELQHTVRILRHSRSRNWLDPKVLHFATNYRHDLTLMAAATYVGEAGNDVRPHPFTARDGVRPDMWIHVGALSGPIEHKAPERLDEQPTLAAAEADRVVTNAFQSARHQIAGVAFALISLGGFRVPRSHLDEVLAAGERLFRRDLDDLRHVVGLLVFSVGAARQDLPGFLPGLYGDRHPNADVFARLATEVDPQRFQGLVACRIVANAHYVGPVPIGSTRDPSPGFYLPRG